MNSGLRDLRYIFVVCLDKMGKLVMSSLLCCRVNYGHITEGDTSGCHLLIYFLSILYLQIKI